MGDNKNNLRVNWSDGMKIYKSHFVQLENAFTDSIHQVEQNAVNPINYGLLPIPPQNENSLDLTISIDGQQTIEVILNRCKAVTSGGYHINLSDKTSALLDQSGYILRSDYLIKKEESEWFVILTVNPFIRVPIGNANPEEEPPRIPYSIDTFKLSIVSSTEIGNQPDGTHQLSIGKVILKDDKPVVDENFIPPCSSIQSHPDLQFAHSEISAFLNQMEAFSTHVIQKIYQKEQNSDLARIALHMSQRVMQYLNVSISPFRLRDRYEPPIAMITRLVGLGRVIKSSLDVYVGTGKEDFLNYLTNWCDLNQGAFENVLVDVIEYQYKHTDINKALVNISSFTKLMLSLFKKLSELDYIGKKENKGIFVKEEVVENKEQKGRRSFLLD